MVAKSDHSPSVEQNGAEGINVAQSAPSSIPAVCVGSIANHMHDFIL